MPLLELPVIIWAHSRAHGLIVAEVGFDENLNVVDLDRHSKQVLAKGL